MKGKVAAVMIGSGVACAVMLWMALWAASGNFDAEPIVGGLIGGVVVGLIMHVLG
jgi:hypothetical protein